MLFKTICCYTQYNSIKAGAYKADFFFVNGI